ARCGLTAIPREFAGDVLIAYGDLPMLSPATLTAFATAHRAAASRLSFITLELADPASYGRVVRDASGAVAAIVEKRDLRTPAHHAIREINTGVYLVDAALLRELLDELKPNNDQNELYLTDIISIARGRGIDILGWRAVDAVEFAGINSMKELAFME